MPEPRPLLPNDPFELGGYRLTGRLGKGAQGTVYLGERDGDRFAVKLLHSLDERARQNFERELTAVRRVASFCTARILAAETDADLPYVVSEYVDGPSLKDLIETRGALPAAELTRLAVGTATALAAIHEAGVVHRDFKPANVLLGPDGPKVIDFGIARPLDATSATMTGAVGTPAYMAPEQFAGTVGGAPLDMFAWACTLAYAANGRPPFGADSVPAIMHRVLYGEPDLGALSGDLRDLVGSCLAKDPAQRPTAIRVLQSLLGEEVLRKGATQKDTEELLAEGTAASADLTAATLPSGAVLRPPVAPAYGGAGKGRRVLMVTGAAAAIVGLATTAAVMTVLNNGDGGGEGDPPPSGTTTSPVAGTADCTYLPKTDSGLKDVGTPPTTPPSPAPRRATITTSLGAIEAELDPGKAPCTVNSFAYLAGRLFYDNTECHRITTDPGLQVLQCGDPTGTGTGGPTYQFKNENAADKGYTRGVIAMANAGPDTNGSQFFIVYGTAKIPGGYTIFGRVTSGMDIVDRVAKAGAEDQNGPGDGRPKQKITITALRTR